MKERITYWRCPTCEGEGKGQPFVGAPVEECPSCRGSGNALAPAPRTRPVIFHPRNVSR